MKIRNDFVSNSSSVSYIITMKKELLETMERAFGHHADKEMAKIRDFVKEDLIQNGTRVYLGDEDIYYKKIEFDTDGGTNTKEWIEAEGKEVDLSQMDDEEIWKYIYGEYIMKGELGKIYGFGVTQTQTY
ncbi:hypothetical protein NK356_06105 [Chryseobacterium sp. S0630]|uniref:hypothetical protein n=1 Tax=Chryseobacterium sp. S0630 TaxID=2957803 RepID=UPI00209CCBFB|nr:hypothetical protein [Chryseobacterium sp. S0630]MCP1298731.1 hypothetical protein [Chryseobacterium sp. S0630]